MKGEPYVPDDAELILYKGERGPRGVRGPKGHFGIPGRPVCAFIHLVWLELFGIYNQSESIICHLNVYFVWFDLVWISLENKIWFKKNIFILFCLMAR